MLSTLCNILVILYTSEAVTISFDTMKQTLKGLPEDALMDFKGVTEKYGQQVEEHEVITEDGYILTLFNIPGDKSKPVLLSHGVFDTSDGWILTGNNSLGVLLATEGYDVWFLNVRGNRYSSKHLNLDPVVNESFWDYSAHELGYYDLAANIDYVLNATGQAQLSLIGFSEGTTMMFILGSTRPEYNKKVKVFIALSPVVFLKNAEGPISFLINAAPFINFIAPESLVEIGGFFSLSKSIMNMLCTQLPISYELCYSAATAPLIGENYAIDRSIFPTVIGHFPAGTSRKNLLHFSQIGLRGFNQYDYGTGKNLEKYFSFFPPAYKLNKFNVDTFLVSGGVDRVSTLKDVEQLRSKVSSVKDWFVIKEYNHLDHLWAKDAHLKEYPYVLDVLRQYN